MLVERPIRCPYCGETITIVVDASVGEQEYVEDCAVCCRPITFLARADDSAQILRLEAKRDDD